MVIGISGKARSGKSTLAELMKLSLETREYTVKILNFADPLKDMMIDILGYDEYNVSTQPGKTEQFNGQPYTGRRAMQIIATDMFRDKYDPDVWTDIMRKRITDTLHKYDYVIVSDVRFPNEVECLQGFGATMVHIYRNVDGTQNNVVEPEQRSIPGKVVDFVKSLFKSGPTTHKSEQYDLSKDADYIINNVQGLHYLLEQAEGIVASQGTKITYTLFGGSDDVS